MAEFYGTVAAADAYHAARGNVGWTGTNDAKQAALVRGSAYVDGLALRQVSPGVYEPVFSGTKVGGRGQLLQWPRTGAIDSEGNAIDSASVPVEVEYATYEAALRELTTPGSLSPDYVPSAQVKREKVDVLEVEYVGGTASSAGSAPNAPVVGVILALLAPLISQQYSGPAVFVV